MSILTPGKYLSRDEQEHLESLLDRFRAQDLRNTTMILFMLKTGCRPSEVTNLTWGDINFGRKAIFIKTLKKGNPRWILLRHDLLSRFKEMGVGDPSEKIFKIKYNQFRNIWTLYRPVKKKLHCLRHTFAMNAYKDSKHDIRAVQNTLGHKDLVTTCVYLQFETSLADQERFIV